jgi:hypothetical protein
MTQKSVEQLLRVNHAGERGAISIYKGQILISQLLHPEVVPSLGQMLSHEQKHFHTFDEILRARGLRHCHALVLWALGGWALGILTAILGQRAIWTCTAAIESTSMHILCNRWNFFAPATGRFWLQWSPFNQTRRRTRNMQELKAVTTLPDSTFCCGGASPVPPSVPSGYQHACDSL